MRIIQLLLAVAFLASCNSAKVLISSEGLEKQQQLSVKGRQGFLVKQRLSFGEYQTSNVKRSWTKGSDFSFHVPVANDWVDALSVDHIKRKQKLRFGMMDQAGNKSEVFCFSKVDWVDFYLGKKSNSLVNVIGDLMRIGDNGSNTFSVRIATASGENWDMVIDNNAVHLNARNYTGVLAKNKDEYYTVVPVTKLVGKNGKPVNVPLGGSVGFEFRNKFNETVAAVSLIDGGIVYLSNSNSAERFVLANAAAALLLQEEIDRS